MTPSPEGLLLVDKPAGMTSHDVVDVVRRSLGTRKVGHAGTLDPLATGLLVLGVGRATRLLRYLGRAPQDLRGDREAGEETDTLDADGELVRTDPVEVSLAEAERACAALVGDSMQTPPAYSAVKVGGRKLYEAARKGDVLEAPARPIRVDAFEVTGFDGRDLEVLITCSAERTCGSSWPTSGGRSGAAPTWFACAAPRSGRSGSRTLVRRTQATPEPIERAVEHLPSIFVETEEAGSGHARTDPWSGGHRGSVRRVRPGRCAEGIYRDDGAKARPEVVLASGLMGDAPKGDVCEHAGWPRAPMDEHR
jgi:tRNA pseudouridine55 synthase